MKTINLLVYPEYGLSRQLPEGVTELDGFRFVVNAEQEPYDYLVVHLAPCPSFTPRCPKENVIYIISEPPSVLRFTRAFLAQFGWIISPFKEKHPNTIASLYGLFWYIGKGAKYSDLNKLFDKPKKKLISVISSGSNRTYAHKKRIKFVKKLQAHYGDKMDFFGRGLFKEVEDKLEALQDYRFHIVLENDVLDNYVTEKLADCLIAGAYPFYHGAPNVGDYFPKNSYRSIDIDNFEEAVAIIDDGIKQNLDKKYHKELREAHDLCLGKYKLLQLIVDSIKKIESGELGKAHAPIVLGNKVHGYEWQRYRKFWRVFLRRYKIFTKTGIPKAVQRNYLIVKYPLFGKLFSKLLVRGKEKLN